MYDEYIIKYTLVLEADEVDAEFALLCKCRELCSKPGFKNDFRELREHIDKRYMSLLKQLAINVESNS